MKMISPAVAFLRLIAGLLDPISRVLEEAIVQSDEIDGNTPLSGALIHPSHDGDEEVFAVFMETSNIFTKALEERVIQLLDVGVNRQLCHRRFSTISCTPKLFSCIGLSIHKFQLLFALIEDRLIETFPHSQNVDDGLDPSVRPKYADNSIVSTQTSLFVSLHGTNFWMEFVCSREMVSYYCSNFRRYTFSIP